MCAHALATVITAAMTPSSIPAISVLLRLSLSEVDGGSGFFGVVVAIVVVTAATGELIVVSDAVLATVFMVDK
jgi:hypothetical protein